jgi:hydroxymethylglutaryl-CoA reductase
MDLRDFFYNQFPVLLREIHQDTPALWGKMNAQQMIEHLALVVSLSNGRLEANPKADPERLAYRKMRFFEKDVNMSKSIRLDIVPEEPAPMQFPDIEAAKMYLFEQLDRFDDYFNEHPDLTPLHPLMGAFSYDEWVLLHARHFRHHLQQFGILERIEA